jgi:HEAT repeat protein
VTGKFGEAWATGVKIPYTRNVDRLLDAMQHPSEKVRGAAVVRLGELGDIRAVEPLIAALRDESADIRGDAANSLGMLGDARAVEPLIAALGDDMDDPREWARDHARNLAAWALGELGDPRAVEPLIAALAEGHVNAGMAEALARLGDPRAIEPLRAALDRLPASAEYDRMAISASIQVLEERAEAAPAPTASASKHVQGVLVLSRRPVSDEQALLQQIIDQQTAKGHAVAPDFIGLTRVGDWNDQAYVYASVRETFSALGGEDLIDRTKVFPFEATDGNEGRYYVLFDRS